MKINLTAIALLILVFAPSESAQRGRTARRPPVSAPSSTPLSADQALQILTIVQRASNDMQATLDLRGTATSQINEILDVLTPEQKRQLGYYRAEIVDPESGIDLVAKIPCINPDFVAALRLEIRLLLRGDPQSVQQAATVLHPNGNPNEYITVLKQPCGNLHRNEQSSISAVRNSNNFTNEILNLHYEEPPVRYERYNVSDEGMISVRNLRGLRPRKWLNLILFDAEGKYAGNEYTGLPYLSDTPESWHDFGHKQPGTYEILFFDKLHIGLSTYEPGATILVDADGRPWYVDENGNKVRPVPLTEAKKVFRVTVRPGYVAIVEF